VSLTSPEFRTSPNGGHVINLGTQTVGSRTLTVPTDLIFTSDAAGTTLLSWEFERYDPTTGTLVVWVRVPSLTSSTVLYAWYGNAAVTTLQTTPTRVWSSAFLAVYHLAEDPSGTAPQINDSTSNGYHCTAAAPMPASQQVAGQIAGSLSFAGGTYYLTCATPTAFAFERTDSWSLSAWSKPVANTGGAILAKQTAPAALQGWNLFWRGGTSNPTLALELVGAANNRATARTSAEIPTGSFHHLVATYAGTSTTAGITLYVDGVSQAKTVIADTLGTTSLLTTATPEIAARGGSDLRSTATDDELRVYAPGIVLSPAWIATEYNNQRNPAAFFTVATGLTNE